MQGLTTYTSVVLMQGVQGYNATVPVLLNFTSATPCWLNLRPGTVSGFGANSFAFNIIGEKRKDGSRVFGPENTTPGPDTPSVPIPSMTASAPPPTMTEPKEATATPKTPPPANESVDSPSGVTANSSAPIPSSTGSGSLNAAAAAGVGAGVAAGILAIAGGVFAWLWRRRVRTRSRTADDMDHLKVHQSYDSRIVQPTEDDRPRLSNPPLDMRREKQHHEAKPRFFAELSSAHHTPPEIASSQVLLLTVPSRDISCLLTPCVDIMRSANKSGVELGRNTGGLNILYLVDYILEVVLDIACCNNLYNLYCPVDYSDFFSKC